MNFKQFFFFSYYSDCPENIEMTWGEKTNRDILEFRFYLGTDKLMTFKEERNIKSNSTPKIRGRCDLE